MPRLGPARKEQIINQRIAHWKEKLRIDPDLDIKTRYISSEDGTDTRFAQLDDSNYEYGSVIIEIFDNLIKCQDFVKQIDETVRHEMIHLFNYPLRAYLNSVLDGGMAKEAQRLDELLTNRLEKILEPLRR